MTVPSFQPQVFQKTQELPGNTVPAGTGLPTYVVANRLGVKGFAPSGAENHWGVSNPQWQQTLQLQPNELASDLSHSNPSDGFYAEDSQQQDYFIPASACPARYAGIDYHGKYPNIQIRPQFAIFTNSQAVPLLARCDIKKIGTPLNTFMPDLQDTRFVWYGAFVRPLPVLRHGQAMSLLEWQQENFQPLPNQKSSKLTADQVVPISETHGIPVGENPANLPITHYCPKRKAFCTSLQHAAALTSPLRDAYGLPGHLGCISPSYWLPFRHDDTFEVHISKLLSSDIVLHKCRISSDGQTITFNLKKNLSRFPSSPIVGTCNQRKTHLCARKFDPHQWQGVNGKSNPDAEIWCFEGSKPGSLRRQHILPVSLGLARAHLQSKIKPALEKYRKMYPYIQPPPLDKPQDMQDYIQGCQLLEQGKAVHIPFHHELHELFEPWDRGIKKFCILPLPTQPAPHKIPPSYLFLLSHYDARWLTQLKQLIASLAEPDRTIYSTLAANLSQNIKRQ
jgi:hypothetical protein